MSTAGWLLLGTLALWVAFNWVAPFAVMAQGRRISPGRLPVELLTNRAARRVRFYTMPLAGTYGYSIWAPPLNVVVFDEAFFARASTPLLRYVVAHELAHFTFGHHRKRWLLVVGFLGLTPWAARTFARFEAEADREAERRTGLTRSAFGGILHHVVPPQCMTPITAVGSLSGT